MSKIDFHPLTLADKEIVQQHVLNTECRNCDLNFMNLMSWRFLYDTEVAVHGNWLLFRFKANGHPAYLAPTGQGDWKGVMSDLIDDAAQGGHPFLMLGVTEYTLTFLNEAMPDYFYATADRSYTDYIYSRESLSTLTGKKLQSKRNFAHRFEREHPDYEFVSLDPSMFAECMELEKQWSKNKDEDDVRLTPDEERRSMTYVMDNWDALGGIGGAIRADGKLIAFSFGGPVNRDTFDVCVEKADTNFDGAFTIINRDFVRHLPEQYIHINREEDLGIEGLRKAKLSYHPELLLHKFTVMAKHPLG